MNNPDSTAKPGSADDSQGTVAHAVSFRGRGLHTGKRVQITVLPASENHGIVFRRIDRKGRQAEIPAHWQNTRKMALCTCIESSDSAVYVRTIEHLMAAFYACGIDNALVEINGSELPILDGSSRQFVSKLEQVGVFRQNAKRRISQVNKTLEVQEERRFIRIEPAEQLELDITISLQKIGRLNWQGVITPDVFSREVSAARTFGRLKNGLLAQLTRFSREPICLGANTRSALVVVKGDQVLNKGGLRMKDEYVRHRMLDLVGDLMLSGGHVRGKITAVSPAHRLTHQLLERIFQENAYRMAEK